MNQIIKAKNWQELYDKLADEDGLELNIEKLLKGKIKPETSSCLHDTCQICKGSGTTPKGHKCVNFISCRCPKCTPTYD